MLVINSDYEPIVFADGSFGAPKDPVTYRLGMKDVPGWLALDPKTTTSWSGEFGIRYQGYRFLFVGEETIIGDMPPIWTSVQGKVSPRTSRKAPPENWINQDGFLTPELYVEHTRMTKMSARVAERFARISKVHGRKRGEGEEVGIFIPLPKHLARKFPTLYPNDSSPSHVTFMFLGSILDPEEQKRLVDILRQTMKSWWRDATATLGEMGVFHQEDHVVPHVKVDFDRDFKGLRIKLRTILELEGFPVDTKFVDFKPHVTLGYVPSEEWNNRMKAPRGTWDFDYFEVWGLPEVHRIYFKGEA